MGFDDIDDLGSIVEASLQQSSIGLRIFISSIYSIYSNDLNKTNKVFFQQVQKFSKKNRFQFWSLLMNNAQIISQIIF